MFFTEDHTSFEDNSDNANGEMGIETAFELGLDMFTHIFTGMADDEKLELISRLESIERASQAKDFNYVQLM